MSLANHDIDIRVNMSFRVYCVMSVLYGLSGIRGPDVKECNYRICESDGKRTLGRPRRKWVDNIRMDLQEVECGYMDWIELAQDRDRWRTLVSAVMNRRVQ